MESLPKGLNYKAKRERSDFVTLGTNTGVAGKASAPDGKNIRLLERT